MLLWTSYSSLTTSKSSNLKIAVNILYFLRSSSINCIVFGIAIFYSFNLYPTIPQRTEIFKGSRTNFEATGHPANAGLSGRFSLIVFKTNLFAHRATLGNASQLKENSNVYQAVRIGTPQGEGLYTTQVRRRGTSTSILGIRYESLIVEPDVTEKGDSGMGLFDTQGQVVYAINNAGVGLANYGPVNSPGLLLSEISKMRASLNP